MKYELDGIEYDVFIERKNNKNTYTRVKNDLTIHVTTNYLVSDKTIKKLLKENEVFLRKMIAKIEEKNKKKKDFYFLGRKYDIIIIPTIDEVTLKEDAILIKSDKSFEQWLTNNIKTIFKNRLDYCYNLFTEDIVYPKLKIRKMTSRWGVCNRKTLTITLNSNLINYNIETIDYVIIHELSHLVHFNHSKEFWKVVSKYCPNYKQIRKSLKE